VQIREGMPRPTSEACAAGHLGVQGTATPGVVAQMNEALALPTSRPAMLVNCHSSTLP
jgi:hypothetical protein